MDTPRLRRRRRPRGRRRPEGAGRDRGVCPRCRSTAGAPSSSRCTTFPRVEPGRTYRRQCPSCPHRCRGCSRGTRRPARPRRPCRVGTRSTRGSCLRPWNGTCSRSSCAGSSTRSCSRGSAPRACRPPQPPPPLARRVAEGRGESLPLRKNLITLVTLRHLTLVLAPPCDGARTMACATSVRPTTSPARWAKRRRSCRRPWRLSYSLPCRDETAQGRRRHRIVGGRTSHSGSRQNRPRPR